MAKKPPTFEKNQVPAHLRANRSAFTRWFGKTFLRFLAGGLKAVLPMQKEC